MANHYQNDVIDLTQDSFTITTAHCFMDNLGTVIELDDSVNDENYRPAPKTKTAKIKKSPIRKKTNQTRSPKKVEKPKKRKKTAGIGNCPICWDKLGTNPMASTKCGHVYCMKCLEQSLKRERRCPTCRRELRGSSAYHPIYLSGSNS